MLGRFFHSIGGVGKANGVDGFVGGGRKDLGERGRQKNGPVFSVMDRPSDGSGKQSGDVTPIDGNLRFESVQFAFPSRPSRLIYTNMSLDAAKKVSIGLVGRSGSGKSTILQIVMKFYDITGGPAKLDGILLS